MKTTDYPKPSSLILNSLLYLAVSVAVGFAGGLVGGLVLGVVYATAGGGVPAAAMALMTSIVTPLGNIAAYLVVFRNFGRKSGLRLRAFFPAGATSPALAAGFLVLFAGGFLVLSELDNVLRAVLPMPAWLGETFAQLAAPGNKALGFLNLVAVPAFFEEVLFRGYFLQGLRGRKSMRFSVLLTAFLFGIVHLNPWQFASAFLIGLAFGWVAWRTGSILWPMAGHALNNLLATAAEWYPEAFGALGIAPMSGNEVVFQPWPLDLAAVVLLAAGLLLTRRALAALPEPRPAAEPVPSTPAPVPEPAPEPEDRP